MIILLLSLRGSITRRRRVEIHTQFSPGLRRFADHQTPIDPAAIRSELKIDKLITITQEMQNSCSLVGLVPLVGGIVLSAVKMLPRYIRTQGEIQN
ncbi:hypothetical protein J6590_062139 [Homalodisca vitripennis]|nr:hypothetical protein J6590_062139 [Homalodisca vitripennis]